MPVDARELFKKGSEAALPVVKLLRDVDLSNDVHYEKVKDALRTAQRELVLKIVDADFKKLLWVNVYFSRHFDEEFQPKGSPRRDPNDYVYSAAHVGIKEDACDGVHSEIKVGLPAEHLSVVLRKPSTPMVLAMSLDRSKPGEELTFAPPLENEEDMEPWSTRLSWYVDKVFKSPHIEGDPFSLLYVHLGLHRPDEAHGASPLQASGVYLMFSSREVWEEYEAGLTIALRAFLGDILHTHVWTSERRASGFLAKQATTLRSMATSISHEYKNLSSRVISDALEVRTIANNRAHVADLYDEICAKLKALELKCLYMNTLAVSYELAMTDLSKSKQYEEITVDEDRRAVVHAAASIAVHLFEQRTVVQFTGVVDPVAAQRTLSKLLGIEGPWNLDALLAHTDVCMAIAPFMEPVRNVRVISASVGGRPVTASVAVELADGRVTVRFTQEQTETKRVAKNAFESSSLKRFCEATTLGLGLTVRFHDVECRKLDDVECPELSGPDAPPEAYLVRGATEIDVPKVYRRRRA